MTRAGDDARAHGRERRPRGRRPAGADTRGEILAAAGIEFADRGFDGASVRGIARRAGVDPALVRHYFADKAELFAASILPAGVSPPDVADRILAGGPDGLGERLVSEVLSIWGADGGVRLRALVSGMAGQGRLSTAFGAFLARTIFSRLAEHLPADARELRIQLAMSQVIGVLMVRYVLGTEPVASLPEREIARRVGPTVDRYLLGPLVP